MLLAAGILLSASQCTVAKKTKAKEVTRVNTYTYMVTPVTVKEFDSAFYRHNSGDAQRVRKRITILETGRIDEPKEVQTILLGGAYGEGQLLAELDGRGLAPAPLSYVLGLEAQHPEAFQRCRFLGCADTAGMVWDEEMGLHEQGLLYAIWMPELGGCSLGVNYMDYIDKLNYEWECYFWIAVVKK